MANLTELTCLSLSYNNFSAGALTWLAKLSKLTDVYLESINLSGGIPSSLRNLTQLTRLNLPRNQLTGPIPSWLGNLTKLVDMNLSRNKLHGSLPESIYKLVNLQNFMLDTNNLSGIVEFDKFLKLQNLIQVFLSNNKFELRTESRIMNATVSQFRILGLGSCNLSEFPYFLRYQERLEWLDLHGNKLHGQVPKWMLNTGTETLQILELSFNHLSGFDHHPLAVLPWVNMRALEFMMNLVQGPLPIPPPYTEVYNVAGNKLSGEISPLICNMSFLVYLDLSNNKLSGMLPQCLGNFSDYLLVLNLGNNSFQGSLPLTYSKRSNLTVIDVSHNQLQGQLPKSLEHCMMLEFLLLSNNKFSDVFPFWLGRLPELKVLAISYNEFHGAIGKPQSNHCFPNLRIFDLSHNNFSGEFLIDCIFSEMAMMRSDITVNQSTYMKASLNFVAARFYMTTGYDFSITITNKGVERYYSKIQEAFAAIDISSNRFEGKIHEFVGKLKGLRSLNISNNILTSGIPSFLGNLALLESLDLSQNKLSEEIPQQLAQLTFLAEFSVFHNNLTGPIPHGTQLTLFNSSSYEGNPGLCGDPLPKKCGNAETTQLPPSRGEENDLGSRIRFDWKFVLAGIGSGL